jgi:cytochrome c biogenesis protein CcmG, thiol:disulfide interchange protein DsbE
MKHLFITLSLALICSVTFGQNKIPSVKLKDLEGSTVDTSTMLNEDGPTVICFWATWCSPCKRELNNYAELYEEWQEETGVKIIAVSIDDQRSSSRVAPYINSVEWEFDVLLDVNSQFKRAMNVNNVPHTFLVDKDGNVVWQHNNYADGDEDELFEQLENLK